MAEKIGTVKALALNGHPLHATKREDRQGLAAMATDMDGEADRLNLRQDPILGAHGSTQDSSCPT